MEQVPDLMRAAAQRSSALNSRTLDLVEAAVLSPHVGETFSAVVIRRNGERGTVQIADPPVTASMALPDSAAAGATIQVVLNSVDVAKGQAAFAVV
jgi:exoribonuclease R